MTWANHTVFSVYKFEIATRRVFAQEGSFISEEFLQLFPGKVTENGAVTSARRKCARYRLNTSRSINRQIHIYTRVHAHAKIRQDVNAEELLQEGQQGLPSEGADASEINILRPGVQ